METVIKSLQLVNIQMVDDCPFHHKPWKRYRNASEEYVEYEKQCSQCKFKIDEKTHGWEIHKSVIKFVDKGADFDPYGGLPQGTYTYTIKCANCRKRITNYSGLSSISNGEIFQCKKCNTIHKLMSYAQGEGTFYVPIREL